MANILRLQPLKEGQPTCDTCIFSEWPSGAVWGKAGQCLNYRNLGQQPNGKPLKPMISIYSTCNLHEPAGGD